MDPATISGQADTPGIDPFSMPLVFLYDKTKPPTETAVCEAASMAVVKLLDDPRTSTEPWKSILEEWQSGRFRKVVRRAKPSQFPALHEFDGVTVESGGATVRAFLPFRTQELPKALNRLQVSGVELEPGSQGVAHNGLTTYINPSLGMSVGKKAAQAAHVAHLAYLKANDYNRKCWREDGLQIGVVLARGLANFEAATRVSTVQVVDAGLTEVPSGSLTACGLMPSWTEKTAMPEAVSSPPGSSPLF